MGKLGGMSATYRATVLTKRGGPEVLELRELPMPEPGPGELRVRVLATGVGATDVTMRRGYYPFAPKIPFAPGYETVGIVDRLGPGVTGFSIGDRVCALTVYGGYATHVVRDASDWVHVPAGLDSVEVAAAILNNVTAYQAAFRVARVQEGSTALVTAANGGVGQALTQLLIHRKVRVLASARASAHPLLRSMGADPIEGRARPVDEAARAALPEGVDAAFDGVGGETLRGCIRATRRHGTIVWYGFMGVGTSFAAVARNYFDIYVGARLSGKRADFYGITALYRRNKEPFREDLRAVFDLLAERVAVPRIAARLPLDEAREANVMLERGGLDGKIVLVAPEGTGTSS